MDLVRIQIKLMAEIRERKVMKIMGFSKLEI